ncbi:UDP-Glycosyltransferase superfamily protein [Striga asiatica]|uniref:Glycosyltransferase n=1 Tax=Striga asiatica TaxID=4170 RepID=A0A5A7P7Y8_STRAF|nr:UDP-Glycosyltransferase superfamily protein [Striga asiatica]
MDTLHVAIVSSPGMGHLIPALVLAQRLAAHHNVHVTVLVITVAATSSPPETSSCLLHLRHDLIHVLHLPPPDISRLVTPSTPVVAQICLTVRKSLPLIRSAVAAMDRRPDALIADFFCTETAPLAAELAIPKYVYVPSTAWFTALTLHCPVLDREIKGQYVDQSELIQIPGCKPLRPADVVDPMLDRDAPQYDEYRAMGERFLLFDGILLNTWEDLESYTLNALKENEAWRWSIPVHPIGPLTRPVDQVEEGSNSSSRKLMCWLDRQPEESVVLVSFGSGGTLSEDQTRELARGLELSGQRFVWVVRPPSGGSADGAFFDSSTGHCSVQMFDFLPEGFQERVGDRGFLVAGWVPQAAVLEHRAVGGFVSHCGWNSTLESVTRGVPMVAWPLYSEQRMNAALLAEEAGLALRVSLGVVGGEEVEGLVRGLMGEGQVVVREKVRRLRRSAMEALKEGGTSHKAMCDLLHTINLRKATHS